MAFFEYNIGLDFGTYQSKVCVLHLSSNPRKHEFFQFHINQEERAFFLPSRVELLHDDTFRYGFESRLNVKEQFTYFKIAAAEDKEFRLVSALKEDNRIYNRQDFGEFSPEFLSVLYLTYILFEVKHQLTQKHAGSQKKGLFRRVFSSESIDVKFTVQLGIPTEWSKKINLQRRKKFENILLVSELLQKEVKTIDVFLNRKSSELADLVREIQNRYQSKNQFLQDLNNYGISVYPEAAAGLTFLVKTKMLEPGYYTALDIGGGSSDLSFFKVTRSNTIKYLASEAFMVAANNVYMKYSQKKIPTISNIQKIELDIISRIKSNSIESDLIYWESIKSVMETLHERMRYIFNKRVYWYFQRGRAIERFRNQPCFVFGGGECLPTRFKHIRIHDHGGQDHNPELCTYVIKKSIEQYIPPVNILPASGTWKGHFPLLVIAFGLSFVHHNNEYLWDETEYKSATNQPELVPHPFNEDMYIYDFLVEKWR